MLQRETSIATQRSGQKRHARGRLAQKTYLAATHRRSSSRMRTLLTPPPQGIPPSMHAWKVSIGRMCPLDNTAIHVRSYGAR